MKTAREAAPLSEARPLSSDAAAGTRDRVARAILEDGPTTAAALASRLQLTPAAIRRHLETLLADGLIEAREARVYGHRSRGRPAKVFALTEAGRDAFEQSYDSLAVSALRFLAEMGGERLIADFARRQVADMERRYRPLIDATPPDRRVQVLAEALAADGYAASSREAPGAGEQICQNHCPVAHVAGEFPQLCEAETQLFADLLGTHVQRLATIAHGDGVCTTYIPRPDPPGEGGHIHPAAADSAAHQAAPSPFPRPTGNPSERTTA